MLSHIITDSVSRWPLPSEALTFFLAMLPIVEARGAIPVGHGVFGLSWLSTFVWSYFGSLTPGVVIMVLAEPIINWCSRKSAVCNRIIGKTLAKTRERFSKRHAKFGDFFLLIVAAIPLPLFGIWTGALAAIVFGIPRRRAIWLMAVGNAIACVIIMLASMGLFKLL